MCQASERQRQKTLVGRLQEKGNKLITRTRPQQVSIRVNKPRRGQTKGLCCESGQQRTLRLQEVASLVNRNSQEDTIVVVIENINLDWIAALRAAFGIDDAFFREHALNPEGFSPWQAVFGQTKSVTDQRRPIQRMERVSKSSEQPRRFMMTTSWHVDGVFSWEFSETCHQSPTPLRLDDTNFLKRHLKYDLQYGWQTNTRISHCQLNSNICQYTPHPIHWLVIY